MKKRNRNKKGNTTYLKQYFSEALQSLDLKMLRTIEQTNFREGF